MSELTIFKQCLLTEAKAIIDTINNFGDEVIEAIKIHKKGKYIL